MAHIALLSDKSVRQTCMFPFTKPDHLRILSRQKNAERSQTGFAVQQLSLNSPYFLRVFEYWPFERRSMGKNVFIKLAVD
jgi:hypothetical protein